MIRYWDSKKHPKGTVVTINALDLEQASLFAGLIAEKLIKAWDSNVHWEFYKI